MTSRLSSGTKAAVLAKQAEVRSNLMTATTISFGDGTGTDGRDQILDSGNGLGDFIVGDLIRVAGSTSNNRVVEILAVSAGAIEVPPSNFTTEAAGDQVILAAAQGGSYTDVFRNAILDLYTGTQPATADAAETGTKLCSITLASGDFTAGSPTNGINFGNELDGTLRIRAGETWSGDGIADGTAGWARLYANDYVTGASTTAERWDYAVGTSGAQINLSTTTVETGVPVVITSVSITIG